MVEVHRVIRVAARGAAAALLAALALLAVLTASASAHATLLAAKPGHGATLERSPAVFVLTFDEAIETDFVNLRVEDADGRRADLGEPYHPGGREEQVAIRLERDLEGTLVARYRVISEDGHPVRKRTVFRVQPAPTPSPEESGASGMAPSPTPASPPEEEQGGMAPSMGVDEGEATGVTGIAFTASRGAGYLALAAAIGAWVFASLVWLPALRRQAGAGADWRHASEGFARWLRRVTLGAVLLGLVSTAMAIALEAATAAGITFWAALDPSAVEAVRDTRAVQAWSVRFVLFLVLGVLFLLALRPARAPVLRRAALGAEGLALAPFTSRPHRLLTLAALVALAFTAPMAGHAASHSPTGLLICADAAHVLCMSVWLGGLGMLLVAVGVAGRLRSREDATPLLAAVVGRFSRVAVVVVAILVLTGVTQSIVLVGSLEALTGTAYGRLVLAKAAVMVGLLALGAYNQRRSLPRLRRLAEGGQEPGRAAAILRRAVALEVAFMLVVLGVTSVLVASEPPGA